MAILPYPGEPGSQAPGGPIFNVFNMLRQASLDTKKKQLENQYYGQTAQANALSKLAYANLMGPQFLAKLMGNEHIAANIPDNEKNAILERLKQAGTGQGTGNALQNFIQPPDEN